MSERPQLPPVLYVPTGGTRPDGSTELDLRRTQDGKLALLVYTALDRLVDRCGSEQPWVVVHTAALDELNDRQAYDVIFIDLHIPAEHRRSEGA